MVNRPGKLMLAFGAVIAAGVCIVLFRGVLWAPPKASILSAKEHPSAHPSVVIDKTDVAPHAAADDSTKKSDAPTPVDKRYVVPIEESLAANKALAEEFKQRVRANVAAIQRGEPIVRKGSVPGLSKRIALMRPQLKSVEDIVATGLTRAPSDVSATSLETIGALATGAKVAKGWTGIGRVFNDPQLGPVMLSEVDLTAGNNATTTMPLESINASIRNQPGVLSVLSDPDSGLSMTKLIWVDGKAGVSYEMITEKTDLAAKSALLRIAESIRP